LKAGAKSSDMTRPGAVVFDLGKVLVDFDYRIAGRGIAARGALSADAVQEFIEHSPLLFRFETGQISTEQFFAEVRAATAFRGTFAEFGEFFADIFTAIEPMVQLHAELYRHGVPTYIFSNTNCLAVAHIRKNFPFFSDFDGYIYSFEHGAMKPDPRLYEVVEQRTRLRGPEIVYLDDRPENVATGLARGWRAFLHESAVKSLAALESTGLPVRSCAHP